MEFFAPCATCSNPRHIKLTCPRQGPSASRTHSRAGEEAWAGGPAGELCSSVLSIPSKPFQGQDCGLGSGGPGPPSHLIGL